MMTKILRGVAVASAMVCTSGSYAASGIGSATVGYAGTYGNGDVFVGLSVVIPEPGCAQARVDVPRDSPAAAKLLEMARLARDKGLTVNVQVNGCYGGYPTLDNTRGTWFNFN